MRARRPPTTDLVIMCAVSFIVMAQVSGVACVCVSLCLMWNAPHAWCEVMSLFVRLFTSKSVIVLVAAAAADAAADAKAQPQQYCCMMFLSAL